MTEPGDGNAAAHAQAPESPGAWFARNLQRARRCRLEGRLPEAEARLLRLADPMEHEPGQLPAPDDLYLALGRVNLDAGRLDVSEAWCRRAWALSEARADAAGQALAAAGLSDIELARGNLDAARTLLRQALSRLPAGGSRRGEAEVRCRLGEEEWRRGGWAASEAFFRDVLALPLSDDTAEARAAAQLGLGRIEHLNGRLDEAAACYGRARAACEALGDDGGAAEAGLLLGRVQRAQHRLPEAGDTLRKALALRQRLGVPALIAPTWRELGLALAEGGLLDQAERAFEEALAQWRAQGAPLPAEDVAGLVEDLGDIECRTARDRAALAHFDEALRRLHGEPFEGRRDTLPGQRSTALRLRHKVGRTRRWCQDEPRDVLFWYDTAFMGENEVRPQLPADFGPLAQIAPLAQATARAHALHGKVIQAMGSTEESRRVLFSLNPPGFAQARQCVEHIYQVIDTVEPDMAEIEAAERLCSDAHALWRHRPGRQQGMAAGSLGEDFDLERDDRDEDAHAMAAGQRRGAWYQALGALAEREGRLPWATQWVLRALATAREDQDPARTTGCHRRLAQLAQKAADSAAAQRWARWAGAPTSADAVAAPDAPAPLPDRTALAAWLDGAAQRWRQAMAFASTGECWQALGVVELARQDLDAAEKCFQEALAHWTARSAPDPAGSRSNGQHPGVAACQQELGIVELLRGNGGAAERWQRLALDARVADGALDRVAESCDHMGMAKRLQGQAAEAERHWRLADQIRAVLGDRAAMLRRYGKPWKPQDHYDESGALDLREMSIWQALGDHRRAAMIDRKLGAIEQHRGRWHLAEPHYRAALATFEQEQDFEQMRICYGELSLFERRRGHLDAAEQWHRKELDAIAKAEPRAAGQASPASAARR
jgi:tetratricopeptide (TPR) repeat protein